MNVQRTQPIFLFKKSIKKLFEDLYEIFLENNNFKKERESRAQEPTAAISYPEIEGF